MTAIFINTMINLMMFFNSIVGIEECKNNKILELPKLEESVNLPLTKIIDDILSDSYDSDQYDSSIYVFSISRFNQGIRVDVHEEAHGKIDDRLAPLGYLLHGNKILIIVADNWLIEEGFIARLDIPDKLTVMAESRHPGVIYDPDSWLYKVSEENFARHVNGIGWVWTFCNKEIDRSKLHRFLIEAPKRTKNKSSK